MPPPSPDRPDGPPARPPSPVTGETGTPFVMDPAAFEDDPADLYERAPCGFLSVAEDGTIVRLNQTFSEWTGHTHAELVGRRRFADLISVGGRIYWDTHLRPLLDLQEEVKEVALDVVRADGTRLPVLVNVRNHKVGDGLLVRRITVFDATDRRSYERELLSARRRAEESEEQARVLAATLQRSLLPPTPPAIPGFDVAAVYRPAGRGEQVGGDFYDVFELGSDDWAVVMGDVCGKGTEAAIVTALARYTIRASAIRTHRPSRILEMLDTAMHMQKVDRFCTVALARFHPPGGEPTQRVTLSLGGHPPPILVPAGQPPRPVGQPGSLLGVFDEPTLHDSVVEMAAGDALVFFTDGVTEARREDELFDTDRLLDLLHEHRGLPARDVADLVVTEALAFQGGVARDDIAVVVVLLPPAGGPGTGDPAAGDPAAELGAG